MNKILITGGAGFIGLNLTNALLKRGFKVTILDSVNEQIHGNNDFSYLSNVPNLKFIKGDITDKSIWRDLLFLNDTIIHLAAETGTGQSMYKIENYIKTNVYGTSIMLDLLTNIKHSIKKVIVASSRALYGEGKHFCIQHGVVYPNTRSSVHMDKRDFECKCPICMKPVETMATDESSLINPISVYGISKYNQEQLVLTVCKSLGIQSLAFRFQNVYGPGQSLINPYTGILSIFTNLIRNNKDLNIFEDGLESRDFVYIDDVVNALIIGIENNFLSYEAYNVGSGIRSTVLEVASNLIALLKSKTQIKVTGNYRVGDIRHSYADLSKVSNELGFKPRTDLFSGLNKFILWANKQNMTENSYDKSIEELKEKGFYK